MAFSILKSMTGHSAPFWHKEMEQAVYTRLQQQYQFPVSGRTPESVEQAFENGVIPLHPPDESVFKDRNTFSSTSQLLSRFCPVCDQYHDPMVRQLPESAQKLLQFLLLEEQSFAGDEDATRTVELVRTHGLTQLDSGCCSMCCAMTPMLGGGLHHSHLDAPSTDSGTGAALPKPSAKKGIKAKAKTKGKVDSTALKPSATDTMHAAIGEAKSGSTKSLKSVGKKTSSSAGFSADGSSVCDSGGGKGLTAQDAAMRVMTQFAKLDGSVSTETHRRVLEQARESLMPGHEHSFIQIIENEISRMQLVEDSRTTTVRSTDASKKGRKSTTTTTTTTATSTGSTARVTATDRAIAAASSKSSSVTALSGRKPVAERSPVTPGIKALAGKCSSSLAEASAVRSSAEPMEYGLSPRDVDILSQMTGSSEIKTRFDQMIHREIEALKADNSMLAKKCAVPFEGFEVRALNIVPNTICDTSITFKWSGPPFAADQYEIQMRYGTEGSWVLVYRGNQTGVTVPDLDPCTRYFIRGRYSCPAGDTTWSEPSAVKTTGRGGDNLADLQYNAYLKDASSVESRLPRRKAPVTGSGVKDSLSAKSTAKDSKQKPTQKGSDKKKAQTKSVSQRRAERKKAAQKEKKRKKKAAASEQLPAATGTGTAKAKTTDTRKMTVSTAAKSAKKKKKKKSDASAAKSGVTQETKAKRSKKAVAVKVSTSKKAKGKSQQKSSPRQKGTESKKASSGQLKIKKATVSKSKGKEHSSLKASASGSSAKGKSVSPPSVTEFTDGSVASSKKASSKKKSASKNSSKKVKKSKAELKRERKARAAAAAKEQARIERERKRAAKREAARLKQEKELAKLKRAEKAEGERRRKEEQRKKHMEHAEMAKKQKAKEKKAKAAKSSTPKVDKKQKKGTSSPRRPPVSSASVSSITVSLTPSEDSGSTNAGGKKRKRARTKMKSADSASVSSSPRTLPTQQSSLSSANAVSVSSGTTAGAPKLSTVLKTKTGPRSPDAPKSVWDMKRKKASAAAAASAKARSAAAMLKRTMPTAGGCGVGMLPPPHMRRHLSQGSGLPVYIPRGKSPGIGAGGGFLPPFRVRPGGSGLSHVPPPTRGPMQRSTSDPMLGSGMPSYGTAPAPLQPPLGGHSRGKRQPPRFRHSPGAGDFGDRPHPSRHPYRAPRSSLPPHGLMHAGAGYGRGIAAQPPMHHLLRGGGGRQRRHRRMPLDDGFSAMSRPLNPSAEPFRMPLKMSPPAPSAPLWHSAGFDALDSAMFGGGSGGVAQAPPQYLVAAAAAAVVGGGGAMVAPPPLVPMYGAIGDEDDDDDEFEPPANMLDCTVHESIPQSPMDDEFVAEDSFMRSHSMSLTLAGTGSSADAGSSGEGMSHDPLVDAWLSAGVQPQFDDVRMQQSPTADEHLDDDMLLFNGGIGGVDVCGTPSVMTAATGSPSILSATTPTAATASSEQIQARDITGEIMGFTGEDDIGSVSHSLQQEHDDDDVHGGFEFSFGAEGDDELSLSMSMSMSTTDRGVGDSTAASRRSAATEQKPIEMDDYWNTDEAFDERQEANDSSLRQPVADSPTDMDEMADCLPKGLLVDMLSPAMSATSTAAESSAAISSAFSRLTPTSEYDFSTLSGAGIFHTSHSEAFKSHDSEDSSSWFLAADDASRQQR